MKGEDNGIVPFDIALAKHFPDIFGRISAKAYLIGSVPAVSFNYLLVM
jgi:hypothetical protein